MTNKAEKIKLFRGHPLVFSYNSCVNYSTPELVNPEACATT